MKFFTANSDQELLFDYPEKVTSVCVCSNKCDMKRDYSEFIDSCDVVVRISKFNNLQTRLVGTKIDLVVIAACPEYFRHSRNRRNTDKLFEAKELYCISDNMNYMLKWFELEPRLKGRIQYFPEELREDKFTTTTLGIKLALQKFPDAQIYFFGDLDYKVRTDDAYPHQNSKENQLMEELVASGKVVPILEEDQVEPLSRFSKSVELGTRWTSDKDRLMFGSEAELDYIVPVVHPNWLGYADRFRVFNGRFFREKNEEGGEVLDYDENSITVKWDKRGIETYIKNSNKKELFVLKGFIATLK